MESKNEISFRNVKREENESRWGWSDKDRKRQHSRMTMDIDFFTFFSSLSFSHTHTFSFFVRAATSSAHLRILFPSPSHPLYHFLCSSEFNPRFFLPTNAENDRPVARNA